MKSPLLNTLRENANEGSNIFLQQENSVEIQIYPAEAQGIGAFDGGRITETRPIGFPGEGPAVFHVGPLFYWAWATAKGYGKIALHPHKGFEIISYVIKGEIRHGDTLGTVSQVGAGGAQLMQTGSGVSHEEETFGNPTEFFQIWFEPYFKEAIKRKPTYRQLTHEAFPVKKQKGVSIKSIIGPEAPVSFEVDGTMKDVAIDPGQQYGRSLARGRTLAMVAISGMGELIDEGKEGKIAINPKDFAVVHAKKEVTISIQAEQKNPLRLAIIEIPAHVDYPLYKNG